MDQKQQRLLRKLRGELGQTIIEALDDPRVIEIMLNSDGALWIERHGEGMKRVGTMSAPNAESLMGTIADALHTVVTRENPILEGELPLDGSRFEGLLPPIVAHPTFTIRKKASVVFTLDQYIEQGIMTSAQCQAIQNGIQRRANILVVGGTGSGKTTLTNGIIDGITKACPDDRLVIIEDTAEIQCSAENAVILRSSVDVDMLRLLRATMRLRPDRILVGEVRGGEALALLKAWNTGHPGGVATVHANGGRAGLIRLEQLIAETGATGNMAPLIGEAVDLVVVIEKTKGGRRIREIIEVNGVDAQGNYLIKTVESAPNTCTKEKENAVA
ncbi:type IV secretion system protein VirB11 [Marinobacter pelagius]|jgi:type IV secretion system protein VirB11|uniref:Type IV secretion system protein VirB11 n=2 Tax=Marinobacter TaxID=2742 RepID=A0A368UN03_MARNT|nr:type IV secretion system protein VirB11 [Marinobacter pelagius]RBP68692.1 type IV secretion system protein VirB11 [Marinobacter nauticus]RCW30167.1 type IV secretion system protein VirB11 [Marinobacter nauticus]